jgi:cystathionine gamma-synthase
MSEYLSSIASLAMVSSDNPHVVSMKSEQVCLFENHFVKQLTEYVRLKYDIEEWRKLMPVNSIKAKNIIEDALGVTFDYIEDECENVFLVLAPGDKNEKRYEDFIWRAGLIISSRKAEASLYQYNQIETLFPEENLPFVQAIYSIHHVLGSVYGMSSNNIVMANSGMNALYAATKAVVDCQKKVGKTRIIQLDWLPVDKMEIIENSESSHVRISVFDLEQLETWLLENHKNIAVLITEVVEDPLLQCLALPRLYELCSRFSVKLIVDNIPAGQYCTTVLPYCDLIVDSLTKFAGENADLLFGAIVFKDKALTSIIYDNIISPFDGEIKRLGLEILEYERQMKEV